ncbi:MAG: HAMP domain-containing protein [Desulfobacteraceae bacterium]|nr:HAMP domain-containing protein [Desulfobacteraceae bacterium]
MVKKEKIRFGFFPKILIITFAAALLPLGVNWYFSLQNSAKVARQNVDKQFSQLNGGLVEFVDTWIEMNVRMLRQNAGSEKMISMEKEKQTQVLKQIADVYDWNYLAFTVDLYGQNVARNDGKKLKYYGDRMYVKDVLRGDPLGKQVLIGKTSGKPAFVLSVPIKKKYGPRKGVLAIAMTISDVSERIANVKIGETGSAFLVDERGKIIAHQSMEYTTTRRDLSRHPAVMMSVSQRDKLIYYTDQDGQKMVASAQKTSHGWTMVVEQNYEEAFKPIIEARKNAIILGIFAAVFASFIAFFSSRGLSIPIQRITSIADKISVGRLDSNVDYTWRSDEIGMLARAIERLSTSTNILMSQLYGKQKGL